MTQAELYQGLKAIGLPIQYHHFTTPPTPPYLIYLFAYNKDLMANNFNSISIDVYQIELYTKIKDLASEKKVEDKLEELELPYSKIETWIDSEDLFQIIYTVELY